MEGSGEKRWPPERVKMPQLLRDVLYVIDTFHKYAREDSNEATLTYRELKQLIQGEFGDILQSSVIRAVERNLNLLNIDRDGAISFDEFVLTIFNLLNHCYLNIQSLLNSEPRQVSKPEKSNNVDLQANNGAGWQAKGTPPTQDKIMFPSKTASSAELSPEERGAGGHNSMDPHGDTKTCKLLREASGCNDPKNQQLERDEQSQEYAPSTGDNGAQLETNEPMERSGHTNNPTKQEGQYKEIPRQGDEPTREQSGTETKQEENLRKESSPAEETVQRPRKDQEVITGKGAEGHSETQELQGKDEPSSECADSPEQSATQKPLQLQKSRVPEDECGTAETQEAGKDADRTQPETKDAAEYEHDDKAKSDSPEHPAQERKQDLLVHHDSRKVSEMPNVRAEEKDGKGIEGSQTRRQKESERKTQSPALEDETQDEKCQEIQEPSKGRDVKKTSKTQELKSQGSGKNHPETEEEARHAEEGTTEEPVSIKSAPAVEGPPGARERKLELALPENQSRGENKKTTNTHDKLTEDPGDQGHNSEPTVTQNKGSLKNSNSLTPEEGDSSSETSDPSGQEDSQSQADLLRETVQGHQNNSPDTQKQVAPGEKNKTQEAVVPAVEREKEQHVEEENQPAGGEHQGQGSGTSSPDPTEEPSEHPETQQSTAGEENRESLDTEVPGTQAVDLTEQLSVTPLPAKEDSRKEEAGLPETQEAQIQSLEEDNSAPPETHLKTKEPATSAKEDERPLGEGDDQSDPAKKGHDSSVSQPGLNERTQKAQEPQPVERSTVYSNPLYTYLQEKILQQIYPTQEEHQKQAQTIRASSPELSDDLSSASLISDSQVLQQCTQELLPDEDLAGTQQASVLQTLGDEKDGPQREEPEPQREASTTKQ
ncbi:Trichohyalin-like protein 1 [Galemys pyrenaicus]|uniref:Trichohyalin-like protein 1 n=1 Tax=Galemys pyrenaicus TaxID=202257 RepID=A0A8J6AJY2_GALPY|nr:Trichohyalin-like protein 1 [Galemys pyrenaicus]